MTKTRMNEKHESLSSASLSIHFLFAACRDRATINRWATKQHRINPILRCESLFDRALYRSPQIYLRAFTTEQGDVCNDSYLPS
jgi:hypothetical protein